MSLHRIGPCEITNSFRLSTTTSRAGAWLATRLFIHGRPSTLTPCPSVVQLVIVMPTPRYSRVPYALCPALHPPALYNRYRASGVCTAGPCPLRGVGWPSYRGQSLQSGLGLRWRLITSPIKIGCTFLRRPLARFRPAFRRLALLRVACLSAIRRSTYPFGYLPGAAACRFVPFPELFPRAVAG